MKIPRSTYRLQVTPDTHLEHAAGLLDYLSALGVDWLYLSPVLRAAEGSDHGYDVVSPLEVDPARGGPAALEALCRAAHQRGLGVLLDIVPNHQGIAVPEHNPWWWSVLRDGPQSPYAAAFDIDWDAGGGRVLIPVLADEAAVSDLRREGDRLYYWDTAFPLAPGSWAEGDTPQQIHDRQHYRLVDWRRGDRELNYRRFFTVTTLAGVRVEDPAVLEESHREIFRLTDAGLLDGLRVDHPDGLRDPGGYLAALRARTGLYTVVEKILEPGEPLPPHWAAFTEGTTGYDALGEIDRLLTDPAGEVVLGELDTALRSAARQGAALPWPDLIHAAKRAVTDGSLHAEMRRLARSAAREDRAGGLDESTLVDALSEVAANFPVYRTYLPFGREHLQHALDAAARRRPDLAHAWAVVGPLLGLDARSEAELSETARRFQQTSGMVMAKGVEDSAFYRYSRLTSLNEVGGDPSQFALSPAQAHALFAARERDWPHALTALSTHDTKRSEGVRARITVLSECPGEWAELLRQVQAALAAQGLDLGDGPLLNLVAQALVGAWPVDRDRAAAYALKAAREAGTSTAWIDGDAAFEARLSAVTEALVGTGEPARLLEAFALRVMRAGYCNSLAQKLLQLTMPGVPDVYQGSEVWSPSLVDPDNRRPVDYADLRARLARLDGTDGTDGTVRGDAVPGSSAADEAGWPVLHGGPDDAGDLKLWLTSRTLRLRRERPDLFRGYAPQPADGPQAEHAFAFARGGGALVTVVTRLPLGLERAGGWTEDTRLTLPLAGHYRDILTGAEWPGGTSLPLGDLLGRLPVALLVQVSGATGRG